MSKALYSLCHSDERVAPLAFTVRHWARCCGITHPNPGPWLSNFMLTLLVVHSLQDHPKTILPPLKAIIDGAKGKIHQPMSRKQLLFVGLIFSWLFVK